MVLDDGALADAIAAREELERAQDRMELARADFNRAVTRMHISGASLREIAEALGLSHQRVHQIVDERRTTPAEEVTTTRGRLVHCSFCNKSQKQVKKLIAGPGVYVCEECLGEIHLAVLSRPHDRRVTLVQAAGSNCSFCGKSRNKVAWMSESVREPHERICNECVSLCDNIIHEETGSLT